MVPNLASQPRSPLNLAPALLAALTPPCAGDDAAALHAAAATARTRHARNCVRRMACFLLELAAASPPPASALVPLSRARLAEVLGMSLSKVKRTLAVLSLSQVVAWDDRGIRVRDWRRLATAAGVAASPLDDAHDLDEPEPETGRQDGASPRLLTTSGDPAYFC